jgi:hypothetical protein
MEHITRSETRRMKMHGSNIESGIMTLLLDLFPSTLARRTLKACHAPVAEFYHYFNDNRDVEKANWIS